LAEAGVPGIDDLVIGFSGPVGVAVDFSNGRKSAASTWLLR
jgi:hypothetical protein